MPPFTVRQYLTVKEVRLHSDWSSWNSCCHARLQHGGHGARHIGGTAVVCQKKLAPRLRLGRGGDCVRAQGVGRDGTYVRGQGVGRDGTCVSARALKGRARRSPRLSLEGSGDTELVLLPFVIFYPFNLDIMFYGTQQKGLKSLLELIRGFGSNFTTYDN